MRECGRNDRPTNSVDAQPCLSDVYKNSTRARRRQADAVLSGRSMVEMLGVLAIIGVLSVGAISGYSKAMLKYKLNKQSEQLTYLLNSTYQLLSESKFMKTEDKAYNMTDMLIKLNLVPQEMIKDSNFKFIYDAMGNEIFVGWEKDSKRKHDFFKITLFGVNNRIDDNTCINVLNFSKEMSGFLWQTHFIYSTDEDDSDHYDVRTYGDAYCGNTYPCLKDLTVARIRELCDTCLNQTICNIRILWY